MGVEPKLPSHAMEIYLRPEEEKWADDFLATHKLAGQKILGIHVGSEAPKICR